MNDSLSIKNRNSISQIIKKNILIISIIVLFIFFSVACKGFLSVRNIFVILRSMSTIAIIGVGLTFVLTIGEIDLSIASLPAIAGCMIPYLLEMKMNIILITILAIAVAVGFGFINGALVSQTKLPGIILTMAVSMIASGIAWTISNQRTNVVQEKSFLDFFGGTIGRFPVIVIWMGICTAVGTFMLHKTRFGKNVAFVGENREAARYAGINVNLIILIAFVLSGLFCAIGGFAELSIASSAHPAMLSEKMMTVIAAVILGGTSLEGGQGNVIGTVMAAFFLTVISNGFLLLGIEQWVLHLINGIVIIAMLILRHTGNNK